HDLLHRQYGLCSMTSHPASCDHVWPRSRKSVRCCCGPSFRRSSEGPVRSRGEPLSLLLPALRKLLDGYDVQSAWLYGSVARAQDGVGSDVDIAVVLGTNAQELTLRDALMDLEDRF